MRPLEILPIPSQDDLAREERILSLLRQLEDECNTHCRVDIWAKAAAEIKARSPAMVRRMEIERGLR